MGSDSDIVNASLSVTRQNPVLRVIITIWSQGSSPTARGGIHEPVLGTGKWFSASHIPVVPQRRLGLTSAAPSRVANQLGSSLSCSEAARSLRHYLNIIPFISRLSARQSSLQIAS